MSGKVSRASNIKKKSIVEGFVGSKNQGWSYFYDGHCNPCFFPRFFNLLHKKGVFDTKLAAAPISPRTIETQEEFG